MPILGLIENMAGFTCHECGTHHDIFGRGGVGQEAANLGLPFLGSIPLTLSLRLASDGGAPLPITAADDPALIPMRKMAQTLALTLKDAP